MEDPQAKKTAQLQCLLEVPALLNEKKDPSLINRAQVQKLANSLQPQNIINLQAACLQMRVEVETSQTSHPLSFMQMLATLQIPKAKHLNRPALQPYFLRQSISQ